MRPRRVAAVPQAQLVDSLGGELPAPVSIAGSIRIDQRLDVRRSTWRLWVERRSAAAASHDRTAAGIVVALEQAQAAVAALVGRELVAAARADATAARIARRPRRAGSPGLVVGCWPAGAFHLYVFY